MSGVDQVRSETTLLRAAVDLIRSRDREIDNLRAQVAELEMQLEGRRIACDAHIGTVQHQWSVIAALREALDLMDDLESAGGRYNADRDLSRRAFSAMETCLKYTAAAAQAHDNRVWNAAIDAVAERMADEKITEDDDWDEARNLGVTKCIEALNELKREIGE